MNTNTPTNTTNAVAETITFSGLVRVTGKNVTAAQKLKGAVNNGAHVGALISAGKHRRTAIQTLSDDGRMATAYALSVGNIRPVCALLVEVSGKAVSLMEINGKAPYSEFLRMGATLKDMKQVNAKGLKTSAGKAYGLFLEYQALSTEYRKARDERVKAEKQALTATGLDGAPVAAL